jgi:hypothetical protein
LVGWKDFLDIPLGNNVTHRGPAVTSHHNAVCMAQGNNCGSVRGDQIFTVGASNGAGKFSLVLKVVGERRLGVHWPPF